MYLRHILSISLIISTIGSSAQETTTAVATTKYEDPSVVEKVFIGKNYRDIWAMPVTVKVFHVNK